MFLIKSSFVWYIACSFLALILLDFKNKFKKTKELIILTKDLEKKEKGINFIPLWKWLLE